MWIFIGDTAPSKIFVWDTQVSKVFVWDTQVRPVWWPDYLCFTAEQASSTVRLRRAWSPTSVNIETSTDWSTWTDYTITTSWNVITLSNVWDKVYFRNKSETATWFSTSTSDRYFFRLTGKVACTWDVTYLLCKEWTTTLKSSYCFYELFYELSELTSAPSLPATTLTARCYFSMFSGCTGLKTIPALPATTMKTSCYQNMFTGCSALKLSATQDSNYTQAYMIPTWWSGTAATNWNNAMFQNTWWTFKNNPSINTTYYVHKDNTIV